MRHKPFSGARHYRKPLWRSSRLWRLLSEWCSAAGMPGDTHLPTLPKTGLEKKNQAAKAASSLVTIPALGAILPLPAKGGEGGGGRDRYTIWLSLTSAETGRVCTYMEEGLYQTPTQYCMAAFTSDFRQIEACRSMHLPPGLTDLGMVSTGQYTNASNLKPTAAYREVTFMRGVPCQEGRTGLPETQRLRRWQRRRRR